MGTKQGKVKGKTVVIMKISDSDVKQQMQDMKLDYELIDKVKTRSFTIEGLKKIDNKCIEIENEIQSLKRTKPKALWLQEIDVFVKEYKKNNK